MKKRIRLFLFLGMLVAVICTGCGTVTETENNGKQKTVIEEKEDKKIKNEESMDETGETEMLELVFQPPAEIIEIDSKAADPSNDYIKFIYDKEGRISQCYYEIDNTDIYLDYKYKEGSVRILGFSGETLAADKTIKLLDNYDSGIGFTTHEGYYFKGYEF